jgi:membrane peptidoglycan carboxypeptidase
VGAHRKLRRLGILAAVAGSLVAAAAVPVGYMAGQMASGFLALPGALPEPPLPQRTTILAADGSVLATIFAENRQEIPLDRMAPVLRQAVVAIEDSRFFQHGALDTRGSVRALVADLKSGRAAQGGSTLTQQYVKNRLAENTADAEVRQAAFAPTTVRKLKELRYAAALEKRLSKEQILERYLNIVYFGAGAYGVEAAAGRFFGKHAAQLDLTEAATLAGMIRSPTAYQPDTHPREALARRNTVLDRMAALHLINAVQTSAAKSRPLRLHVTPAPNGCVAARAPFFCDYVRHELLGDPVFGRTPAVRQAALRQGGLTVRTSLDPDMQRAAQRAVDRAVPPDNRAGKAAAEVLVRPGTGEITAMALDRELGPVRNPGHTWVNFAADTDHGASIGMQAGSTFKVFTLAAALERDMPFGTRLPAPRSFTPTGYRDCAGHRVGDSRPLGNSADSEGGKDFSLVTGTWHSVNTFFLGLERKVGLCPVVKMAERLGMRQAAGTPLQQYASFTLGFNPVSPARLAAAYAAFGARGRYCAPVAITKVTGPAGRSLPVPSAHCHRALDPDVADAVNHVLTGVLSKGTAKGNGIGRPAAGKTGTVDNYAAAWFAGYTPDLAGAVWVGDPRGGFAHPLRDVCLGGTCYGEVFGADIPAPIWHDTMTAALSGVPAHGFHRPPGRYFSRGDGEKQPAKHKKH